MKLDEATIKRRDLYSGREDEAGGLLAGFGATALPKEPLGEPELDALRRESDAILDAVGVKPALALVDNSRPLSYESKLAFLQHKLTDSANVVLLAARNFESMPRSTVETLYDELIELDQRASARKA